MQHHTPGSFRNIYDTPTIHQDKRSRFLRRAARLSDENLDLFLRLADGLDLDTFNAISLRNLVRIAERKPESLDTTCNRMLSYLLLHNAGADADTLRAVGYPFRISKMKPHEGRTDAERVIRLCDAMTPIGRAYARETIMQTMHEREKAAA